MSERILRVNQLIKRELSRIILKEIDFPKNLLATITRAETSIDLKEVKIYVSVMPETQIRRVLRVLETQVYGLQQKLNKRLKMRPSPRIRFCQEKETSQAGKIEEVLEGLKKREK
jgi:ribosome-binding factor A